MDNIKFNQTMSYLNNGLSGLSFMLNTVVFIVFNRKSLRDLSMSRYLLAVAILDPIFITFGSVMNHSDFQHTSWSCKIVSFIFISVNSMCSWISCATSIDRLISVVFVGKFRQKYKFSFQIAVIIGIVVVSFAQKVPDLIYFDLIFTTNTTAYCDCADPESCQIMSMYDLFMTSVIPFTIMISCTISVFIVLKRSKTKFSKSSNLKKEVTMLKTMVGLDIFFFVCNAPFIAFISSSYMIRDANTFEYIYRATTFILFSHRTFSLAIYLISNKIFRKEFKTLFGFTDNNKPKNTTKLMQITTTNVRSQI